MIDSCFRPIFQRYCVDPFARQLTKCTCISPVSMTLCAMLFGVLAGFFIVENFKLWASIFLLLSGYFDSLDGTLARFRQQASDKGAVLDIVADRVVEFSVILGLLLIAPAVRAVPIVWMLGATMICLTSFLVVGIFQQNHSQKSFHYSAGVMERPEAFVFFLVMLWWPAGFIGLAWVYTSLVFYTAFYRVYQFMRADSVTVE